MDKPAVYTDLLIRMDAAEKEIIPGRKPWQGRREARRWLAGQYTAAVWELADHYATTERAIRKAGPGVAPFFPALADKFAAHKL